MTKIDRFDRILKMITKSLIIKRIKNQIQKLIKILLLLLLNPKPNPMKKIQTKNPILNHTLEPNLPAIEPAKDQIREKKENPDLDHQKHLRSM